MLGFSFKNTSISSFNWYCMFPLSANFCFIYCQFSAHLSGVISSIKWEGFGMTHGKLLVIFPGLGDSVIAPTLRGLLPALVKPPPTAKAAAVLVWAGWLLPFPWQLHNLQGMARAEPLVLSRRQFACDRNINCFWYIAPSFAPLYCVGRLAPLKADIAVRSHPSRFRLGSSGCCLLFCTFFLVCCAPHNCTTALVRCLRSLHLLFHINSLWMYVTEHLLFPGSSWSFPWWAWDQTSVFVQNV